MGFNVYGRTSMITVPAEHPDVSKLFLFEEKSGTAYMAFLDAKKGYDLTMYISLAGLAVVTVSSGVLIGSMGNYTPKDSGAWLNVFLSSACVTSLFAIIGLADWIDAGVKLDSAISIYNASCKF